MAWDMIYSSNSFSGRDIIIGDKNHSIFKLNEFKYSFVTVPTQKDTEKNFKPSSTCVERVKRLSGHNFWGLPTKKDVAYSISDIFKLNYSSSFDKENFNDIFNKLNPNYFRHSTGNST